MKWFRDDIVIIFKMSEQIGFWLQDFRERASPTYEINLESFNREKIQMLDCLIFKGPRFQNTGILDVGN